MQISNALEGLGRIYYERGDPSRARELLEHALSIRDFAGEKDLAAETRLALAALNPVASEPEKLVSTFKWEKRPDEQAEAEILLLRCALEEQQPHSAQGAALQLKILLKQVQDQPTLIAARTALANYAARLGDRTTAVADLTKLRGEASGVGYSILDLEAGLVLLHTVPSEAEKRQIGAEVKRKAEMRGLLRIYRAAETFSSTKVPRRVP